MEHAMPAFLLSFFDRMTPKVRTGRGRKIETDGGCGSNAIGDRCVMDAHYKSITF